MEQFLIWTLSPKLKINPVLAAPAVTKIDHALDRGQFQS